MSILAYNQGGATPQPYRWHYERHEHGKVIEETLDHPMHPEVLRNLRHHHTVIETPLYPLDTLNAMYASGVYADGAV